MKFARFLILLAIWALPASGAEFVLQLPLGAKATYSKIETTLPAQIPIGIYQDGEIPHQTAPSNIRRSVWEMGGEQPLDAVHRSILGQLDRADYEILVSCVASECGGFDFRFGLDVVPAPAMRVDLREYRFVSARQSVIDNPSFVSFLVSRSPVAVYVQMTEYKSEQITELAKSETAALVSGSDANTGLGTLVLEGLEFEAGSTALGSDPNGVVAELADRLKKDTGLKVLLVGHSDMTGSLEGNLKISKARAESVRQELIQTFGISETRVSAHGVGFLSPRASNETEAGQQKNRRVEAVFSRE